ncbi:S-type pyocin domain-containing protein [Pseudomonas sp. SDO5532_S415]
MHKHTNKGHISNSVQIHKDMNMQKPPGPPRPNTSKPGFLEIDEPVHTVGIAPDHMVLPPHGRNDLTGGPFGYGAGGTYGQNLLTVQRTTKVLEQELQIRSNELPNTIEAELAAVRSEGPVDPVTPVQSIVRELGVLNTLWQRKAAEHHSKTATANAFYGGDPFNRHINEFMKKATTMEKWPGPNGIAMQALNQSLRAAVDVRLLSQTLHSLNQRSLDLQQTLSVLQAAEQARLAAEQEAQRVAAEQTRIASEVAAQYIAAERARLEAEAEVQRQAEQLRLENQRQAEEQALREAMEALNAAKGIRSFPVSGAAAANGPVFTVAAGALAVDAATTLAIRTALQSAAAAATTALATTVGTASGVVIVVGVAALVYYALRENKEPYALSVPLSDLATYDANELHAIAQANGEIELPVAIGSRTVGNTTEFSVAATNSTMLPRKVPVRLATYDPVLNVYRTESPHAQSPGMTWTPIVRPGNASTVLPVTEPDVVPYTGATATALEGRIDPNPELDLYSFEDVIYVFPIDSGIPPQYVVFRDRRNEPGVTSGAGQSVSGNWMGGAATAEGAPIPAQIADKLRGREFASFNAFRREFWKTVANDDVLVEQFTLFNKFDIKNGLSPSAHPSEQVGGRKKLEIHHIIPISEGGSVYDVDNLRVLTPKQHIATHSKNGSL